MIGLRIRVESKGGFDNALKWLEDSTKKKPMLTAERTAKDGVNALRTKTPKATGETANGWRSDVKMTAKGVEIVWTNVAHPELQVNLAKLIELGHGTRTGGYVSPTPYIKQAMNPVFNSAGDKLAGEMYK